MHSAQSQSSQCAHLRYRARTKRKASESTGHLLPDMTILQSSFLPRGKYNLGTNEHEETLQIRARSFVRCIALFGRGYIRIVARRSTSSPSLLPSSLSRARRPQHPPPWTTLSSRKRNTTSSSPRCTSAVRARRVGSDRDARCTDMRPQRCVRASTNLSPFLTHGELRCCRRLGLDHQFGQRISLRESKDAPYGLRAIDTQIDLEDALDAC